MTSPIGTEKTIANPPGADAEVLQSIASAAGSAVDARCVILFGSRWPAVTIATTATLTLAVVTAEVELDAQQRHDLREQARAAALSAAVELTNHIDVIVWTDAEYRTKKRSINHVAGRAWREGVVLYGVHETLPRGGDSVGAG